MDYVCLDIETTGTNTVTDKIVQFPAIRYRDGKEVAYFNIMVNPGIPMSAGASEVTGITDEALKSCPRFAEVAQDVADFIGPNPVIMGFNVMSLDIPMIAQECELAGVEFPSLEDIKIIDPHVIYAEMYKRTLSATYKFYTGEDAVDAHDALADVKMTAKLFDAQLRHHSMALDVDAIHALSTRGNAYVDYAGKIKLNENGVPCWTFGKNNGQPVKNDIGFAEWVLRNDFPTSTKKAVRKIIYS